jgi:hypothetical protein
MGAALLFFITSATLSYICEHAHNRVLCGHLEPLMVIFVATILGFFSSGFLAGRLLLRRL